MNVLVIDDSNCDFLIVQRFLEKNGHTAIHAAGFDPSHDLIDQCDCVILDVILNDGSTDFVTKYFVQTCGKPVVVWSGEPRAWPEVCDLDKNDFKAGLLEWLNEIEKE